MKENREQFEEKLLAFVEGQLPPDEAAKLEVFLSNADPQLAETVRGLMDDRDTLRQAPKLRAPADMAERIMEQVERHSLLGAPDAPLQPAPTPWFHSRWAIAAGLLLLFSLFGYFFFGSFLRDGQNKWTSWAHTSVAVKSPAPGEARDATTNREVQWDQSAPPATPGWAASAGAAGTQPADALALAERAAPVMTKGDLKEMGAEPADDKKAERPAAPPAGPMPLLHDKAGHDAENATLVLTLAAQDPGDVQRLQNLLDAFAAADESKTRETEGHAKDAEPRMAKSGAGKVEGKIIAQAEPAAERVQPQRSAANPKIIAPPSPAPQLKAPEPAMIAREKAATPAPDMYRLEKQYTQQAQQSPQAGDLGLKTLDEAAPAFHARLRPEQLDALLAQFTLISLTRGSQTMAHNGKADASFNRRDHAKIPLNMPATTAQPNLYSQYQQSNAATPLNEEVSRAATQARGNIQGTLQGPISETAKKEWGLPADRPVECLIRLVPPPTAPETTPAAGKMPK